MNDRIVTAAILLAVVLVGSAASQQTNDNTPLPISELRKRPVIGDLGVPLGTAVKIKAEIIAGRDLKLGKHVWTDQYLLKVSKVDGTELRDPVILPFRVRFPSKVKLAYDAFDLHEINTGNKAGSLTQEDRNALEKGYIGRSVSLFVHEQGIFAGAPRNPPDGYPIVAETGFHFSNSLVVLTEAK